MIKFAIKSGLIVGAIYTTRDIGVWGPQKNNEEIFNYLVETARPHAQNLKKKLPFEVPALPKTGEVRFLTKHYYNNGVKNTIHFVYMIPCYIGQLAKATKNAFNKMIDSPPV